MAIGHFGSVGDPRVAAFAASGPDVRAAVGADAALVTLITAVKAPPDAYSAPALRSPVTAGTAPVAAVTVVTVVTGVTVVRDSEGGAGHVRPDGFGGAGAPSGHGDHCAGHGDHCAGHGGHGAGHGGHGGHGADAGEDGWARRRAGGA